MPTPKRITPSPATQELLLALYPSVAWHRVNIYEGMPWFAARSFAGAIALPSVFGVRRFVMFFRSYDETSHYGRSIIVHEAFHVYQAVALWRGMNVGYASPFIAVYFAHYLQQLFAKSRVGNMKKRLTLAYVHHPFEVEAYAQENWVRQYIIAGSIPPALVSPLPTPSLSLRLALPWLPLTSLIALGLGMLMPVLQVVVFVIRVLKPKRLNQAA